MIGRRLAQLPSLTPSIAQAAQTTLEAVDVTLLLATASAAQVLASHLLNKAFSEQQDLERQ